MTTMRISFSSTALFTLALFVLGCDSDSRSGGGDGGDESGDTSIHQGLGDGICGADKGRLFDNSHPWNQAVDDAPLDSESDAIIDYLQNNHTDGSRFRIDGPSDIEDNTYGIVILGADDSVAHRDFQPTDGVFYTPDCDSSPVPIPSTGAIEGEERFECANGGDCHLIVVDSDDCRLYEMWKADATDTTFNGGCLAAWDLTQTYTPTLRGDCCTSADAAGLPIAAHMFSPDDIASGEINHAIRFILPNSHMRERIYVRPATHSTGSTSGPDTAPPYGARLRLKSDYDESGLKPAAQVVAEALKTYGMILSDGGNITFTATNDRFTQNNWTDVDLMPGDLTDFEWSDFEVVDLGERFVWDDACNCERTPLTRVPAKSRNLLG